MSSEKGQCPSPSHLAEHACMQGLQGNTSRIASLSSHGLWGRLANSRTKRHRCTHAGGMATTITLKGSALSSFGTDSNVPRVMSLRSEAVPSSWRRSMHWKTSRICITYAHQSCMEAAMRRLSHAHACKSGMGSGSTARAFSRSRTASSCSRARFCEATEACQGPAGGLVYAPMQVC